MLGRLESVHNIGLETGRGRATNVPKPLNPEVLFWNTVMETRSSRREVRIGVPFFCSLF